jgi:dTDP-glucose 4,6-dehydratase
LGSLLVTGAGGFLGSHLCELLVRSGFPVRAFVHYNAEGRWGWLDASEIRDELEVIPGDVRDLDAVRRALVGCEGVFHLAALVGIPYSYVSPLAYLRTNVEGTYNVLEASRALELSSVIVTSTSETYGSARYTPIDEEHPRVAQSPYAATKLAADELARSYHRSFGLPLKIVRPFNAYGPRQSARALIPSIVIQILAGAPRLAIGNLEPSRDLSFVEDTVRAFLEIHRCDALQGESVNVARGEDVRVRDLIDRIQALMGSHLEVTTEAQRVRPEASEVMQLCGDNRKLLAATPWRPRWDLDRGLAATIEWLRENRGRYRADRYAV